PRTVRADGVQQQQPVGSEQAARVLHEAAVVATSDMLEHADRENAIEPALQVAVIRQQDLHGQARAALARGVGLERGDGAAHYLNAITLRGKLCGAAPAAADIQYAHAGLQPQLAADQIKLALLGSRQRIALLPVRAAVDHAGVEHGRVKIVTDVVVLAGNLARTADGLRIAHEGQQSDTQYRRPAQPLLHPGT